MMAAAWVRTLARALGSSSRQLGNALWAVAKRLFSVIICGVHRLIGHGGGFDGRLERGSNRFVSEIAWGFVHIRSIITNSFDGWGQLVSFGRGVQQNFARIRLGGVTCGDASNLLGSGFSEPAASNHDSLEVFSSNLRTK